MQHIPEHVSKTVGGVKDMSFSNIYRDEKGPRKPNINKEKPKNNRKET